MYSQRILSFLRREITWKIWRTPARNDVAHPLPVLSVRTPAPVADTTTISILHLFQLARVHAFLESLDLRGRDRVHLEVEYPETRLTHAHSSFSCAACANVLYNETAPRKEGK